MDTQHIPNFLACVFCFFIFAELRAHSSTESGDTFNIYDARETTIRIDGILDEDAWLDGEGIALAYETFPSNNAEACVETVLKLAYDEENLYFSFSVKDPEPQSIRAVINDRDKLDDNDVVTLFLDPFQDSRRAFFFALNPLGIQQDGVYDTQNDSEDLSWDAIWNSAGRITETGYSVEGAIPFKSLRFPSTSEVQTWRFFGRRVYPRSIFRVFHSMPLDQDNTCLLCQGNLITGLENIRAGTNLEFTPTLTINRFDENADFPRGDVDQGDVDVNVGFDARWGITTDLTLNATLNPDFSNVEADAAQLNVNNRFSLQFPEKRPFFLEGADFFNTPLQAFFTRTIVDPSFGTKITGKLSKNAVGLLVARDQVNGIILPGFQGSERTSVASEVTSVIARYRRDIGENANAGILVTDREGDDYFNRVGGLDAFIRPFDALTLRMQYLHSETQYDSLILVDNDVNARQFGGNSYNFQARYATRKWRSQLTFENRTPGFRADAGFVPQVDLVRIRYWIVRNYWPREGSAITNFGWSTGGFRRGSNDGTLDLGGGWISAFLNGPLQLNYWINPDYIWQQYEGSTYGLARLWTGFDIQPLGNLGINGWINLGPAVDFENNRKADNLQFRLESDIRLGRHIDMTINHRFLRLHLSGETIFIANLTQLQAAYNFNRRMFFRMILQYRRTLRNPQLFDDTSVNSLDEAVFAQLLLSYKLNPQSVVFLGYVDNHKGMSNLSDDREISLQQVNQSLFFKVGYAWRP